VANEVPRMMRFE